MMVAWGLVLALGCGGDPSEDDLEGTTGTGTTDEGAPGVTMTTATTATTTTTGGLDSVGDEWGTSITDGSGTTGGVEDTLFGMSDDMPLVADIPDIKQGLLDGAWVTIEQVRPTSGRASLDLEQWFYVQDPLASAHMGLRVVLRPGDDVPPAGFEVDLEGYVQYDARGWRLDLESVITGGMQPSPPVRTVRIGALQGPTAATLDDSVVEVVEPSPLVVTRRGLVPGTLIVSASSSTSGVLVDLRPFGVTGLVLPPGTQLSRLRGVAEIGGSRPVVLPRSTDDLVMSQ